MGTKTAALTRRPGGRPSTYNLELAAKLCERIGSGMSVAKACDAPGMPHPVTLYRWLAKHPEFRVIYHCALMEKFDMMSEELLKIADVPIDGKVDQERMIRMRQWIMAKELPRKYGKMAPAPAPPPAEPTRERRP